MRITGGTGVRAFAVAAGIVTSLGGVFAQPQAGRVALDPDDIGGVVTSAKGPEAGVWVIAETKDFKTRFIKIVTTDDRGRYVIPDLPRASYQVFVRGYGLVDSPRVIAKLGQHLNLTGVPAPNPTAAAEYYPPKYWFSMMDASKLDYKIVKDGCMNCHQTGNKDTRTISPTLGTFKTSLDAWDHRVTIGASAALMSQSFQLLGAARQAFADWTDRVAAGELPAMTPARPTGIERNIVVTEWDWGTGTTFSHTHAMSYRKDPTVNANGRIWGPDGPNNSIIWLDTAENVAGTYKLPQPSGARSGVMDHLGRPYVMSRVRPQGASQPSYCTDGTKNKFAQYFPVPRGGSGIARFDPKSETWTTVDTCWHSDHNEFGGPPDYKLYFGDGAVVGWVNIKTLDETKSQEEAQGWCPTVLDTNGDGQISQGWTEPNEPVDPRKDHRITFGCYYAGWSPIDNSIWCSGMQNAGMLPANRRTPNVVRMDLGNDPPRTCRAERYEAPPQRDVEAAGERGIAVDSNGVIWMAYRQSDHVSSFDRRKCKGPLNGPNATGQHCPEGWTFYRRQGEPTFRNTILQANSYYSLDVDQFNWSGLGKNTVLLGTANADGVEALLPNGQFIDLHIPYPMGFFTRNLQGRVDAPERGWKGKAAWTAGMSYAPWHQEGGRGTKPTVVRFEVRPNPLAK